ncbi:MAG TPA: hypothetical protein VIC84_09350 [Blastocatellia bacterium]|jgi:hypothetical protein
MIIGRNRLIRELTSDPVNFFVENDTTPEASDGASAKAFSDNSYLRTKRFHVFGAFFFGATQVQFKRAVFEYLKVIAFFVAGARARALRKSLRLEA